MKKLLLTSNGLSSRKLRKEFVKLLNKPVEETKVLIMYTQRRRYKRHIRKIKRTLVLSGINKKNIILANISKKTKKNYDFDIFFSCGGNTFYILDRVRKTGFDKIIKKAVKKGKIYISVSAGSIIVHKSIEIAGWGKWGDINEINLKNLKGLNLTNLAIYPHYLKIMKKSVDEFKKKVKYPVKEIRDRQAVLILGNKIKFLH